MNKWKRLVYSLALTIERYFDLCYKVKEWIRSIRILNIRSSDPKQFRRLDFMAILLTSAVHFLLIYGSFGIRID